MAEGLAVPAGLILAAMLTRSLGPELYGRYGVAVAVVLAIEWLLISATGRASLRVLSDPEQRDRMTPLAVRHHLITGAAATICAVGAAAIVGHWLNWQRFGADVRWLAWDIPLASLCHVQRNLLTVRGEYHRRSFAIAARWVGRVGATWVLLRYGVTGALIAWPLSALAELVVIRALPLRGVFGGWTTPRELWRSSWSQFLFGLGQRVLERADLLVLQASFLPSHWVGIYVAAQNIAILPSLLGAAMTPILLAAMARERALGREPESRTTGAAAFRLAVSLIPLAAVFAFCANEIVAIAFGNQYSASAPLVGFLVASCIGILMLATAASILTSQGRERMAAFVSLGFALPAVGTQIWIVGPFGTQGLAIVSMVAALLAGVLGMAVVYHAWGAPVPYLMLLRAAAATASVVLLGRLDWMIEMPWIPRGALLSVAAAVTLIVLGERRTVRTAFR
jgi:O-antigen/teichoic acid export membrane protein